MDLTEGLAWPGLEPDYQVPNRMTDIWTYTVLRQTDQPSVQGLGGRIMFFNDKGKKPIKIDGTLTVFAFDAEEDDPSDVAPRKKYVFLPEQLEKHYSKSKLGHSYSFWVPWGEVGGPETQISLIARFESSTGETVMSEASQHTLVGFSTKRPTPPGGVLAGAAVRGAGGSPGPVRQVAHQEFVGQPHTMKTTTIDVPPSFARKVLAVGNDPTSDGPARPALGVPPHAASTLEPAAVRTHGVPSSGAWQGPPAAGPGPALQPANAPGPTGSSLPATALGPWGLETQTLATPAQATRFAPRRFPVRTVPSAVPRFDRAGSQPYRTRWPSRLAPRPESDWSGGSSVQPPSAAGLSLR